MSDQARTSDAPDHAPVPKYLVPAFVAAMIAWGLYLGIGAAFPEQAPAERAASAETTAVDRATPESPENKSSDDESRADWRNFRPWRGIVVLACTAIFLGWFWGLQRLYVRRQA